MAVMDTQRPPLHIFRAGQHTAMSGAVVSFSESDLAATVAAYDPQKHEAPLVIGHPKDNAPAWGWVQSLSADDQQLRATPRDVDPAFAELVNARRYAKISASFYPPDSPNNPVPGVYYLRHVGFLGAQPPALKGLESASFAGSADDCIEFSEWSETVNAGLWRRLRDWLIGSAGLETADQVIPDYSIKTLEDAARDAGDLGPAFSESDPAPVNNPPQGDTMTVDAQRLAALEAENARLKAEAEAGKAARRNQANVEFAEAQITAGKLAPADRALVVQVLNLADTPASSGSVLEFGEGDARQPLGKALRDFFAKRPAVVEFGEHATPGRVDPAAKTPINPLLADAEARSGK